MGDAGRTQFTVLLWMGRGVQRLVREFAQLVGVLLLHLLCRMASAAAGAQPFAQQARAWLMRANNLDHSSLQVGLTADHGHGVLQPHGDCNQQRHELVASEEARGVVVILLGPWV